MSWKRALFAVLLLLPAIVLLGGCQDEEPTVPAWSPTPVDEVIRDLERLVTQGPDGFAEFIDVSYRHALLRSPQALTSLGLARALGVRDDRLDSYDPVDIADARQLESETLRLLRSIDRATLRPEDRLTYDVCLWYWDDQVRAHAFPDHTYPISHFFVTSRHFALYDLLTERHPLVSEDHAIDYVARLWQVGTQFDLTIAELHDRASRGFVAPEVILEGSIRSIWGMKEASGDNHPYLRRLIATLNNAEWADRATRSRLLSSAREAVQSVVTPAYERLYDAVQELKSLAPKEIGLSQYENGDAYYQYRLRHFNQTELSPEEIHEIGQREVARLEDEIREAAAFLDLDADAPLNQVFGQVARSSEAYRSQAIVSEYTRLIDEAKQRLDGVIRRLPDTDVIVKGAEIGGYYVPAPSDGSNPGIFYASNQGTVADYRMPSLAYHEAVPGHHLQIATAQELDLPLLRGVETFLGYAEGWALYAERLAWELGWYEEDPHGNLGRLQYEMMRAVRLVVDTGIHAFGWTMREAVDYFTRYTGYARGYAESEIMRYIAWPGQATAYMLGMLEILELRSREQERLGASFDLEAFHEALLESGSVPLTMLPALFAAS